MKETMYRFILILCFCLAMVGGVMMQNSAVKWTKAEPRQVLLVDAYERYSESGTPSWTGIFRDKKLNTRFEWSIEPRTYREFIATNAPQDMVVTASRERMNDPTTPGATIFFGITFVVFGLIGVLWNFIAVIFFRDPYRFH